MTIYKGQIKNHDPVLIVKSGNFAMLTLYLITKCRGDLDVVQRLQHR